MRLEAARFDCWMMSSTLSSNRSHDGGGSLGDQMSGRCATVIEREKMKASIMELWLTVLNFTHFTHFTQGSDILRSFTRS